MSTLRTWVGRTLYRTVYVPLGQIQTLVREGGPAEMRRTRQGRMEMETAAKTLASRASDPALPPLELHLLTGLRFWYQSAFCLYSLQQHVRNPLKPIFYSDGSLSTENEADLRRIFPLSSFVSRDAAILKLDQTLPRERYPRLREQWETYPNIRKLIDPHLGSRGWKLVIDSDLLFFHRPTLLVNWLSQPERPVHAVDVGNAYGYSPSLLRRLARAPLADRVNVGLCGLRSDALDWDWMENTCRQLIEAEGPHYYLEQALVAILVAGQNCDVAPANDYVTLPRKPEIERCEAIMHHYVAESKRGYFQQNWRRFI